MSTPETAVREETDLGGSVKLTLNAAGKVQIDVKARIGDEPGALDVAKAEATRVFNALIGEYPR